MATPSRERSLGRDLKVVFADLTVESSKEADPSIDLAFMLWPQRVFARAVDSGVLLNREILDILQRNLNGGFSLMRRLVEAGSLAEIARLQAAHWSHQIAALIGQSEELANLSVRTAIEVIRGVYPER
jgi:hypothetical protein